MFRWNKNLTLDIDRIDNQHQEIFKSLSKLHDTLNCPNRKNNMNTIWASYENMKDCIILHFLFEERMIFKNSNIDFEKHKNEHQLLVNFIEGMDLDNSFLNRMHLLNQIQFIGNWFCKHIELYDEKFVH